MKDSALIPILLTLVIVFFLVLLYLNGVFGEIDTTDKETFAPADPCGADNLTPIPVSCVSKILTDLYNKQAPPTKGTATGATGGLINMSAFIKMTEPEKQDYVRKLSPAEQTTIRAQYTQYQNTPEGAAAIRAANEIILSTRR